MVTKCETFATFAFRRLITRNWVGKLTDIQLPVPSDPSVWLVAQPCCRVPFAFRKKILNHTDELLSDDITERVANEPTERILPILIVIKKNGDL